MRGSVDLAGTDPSWEERPRTVASLETPDMNDQPRNGLRLAFAAACLAAWTPLGAAESTYRIDPDHTYPSFEADHLGGLSVWRGKFNRSSGRIVMDRAAGTGTVEVEVDVASVDFGNDTMNDAARGAMLFHAARHPRATYRGRLVEFSGGKPAAVQGTLTLRGVERPLRLDIVSFRCMPHPLHKRELCGADARGTFARDAFDMTAGREYGFDMEVALRIQVEAVAEAAPR